MTTTLTSAVRADLTHRAHQLAQRCGQLSGQLAMSGLCGEAAEELSHELTREINEIARIVSNAH